MRMTAAAAAMAATAASARAEEQEEEDDADEQLTEEQGRKRRDDSPAQAKTGRFSTRRSCAQPPGMCLDSETPGSIFGQLGLLNHLK